ncbi:MAG: IS481 family transposase, partial [Acidobacteriota bacterium]|nr:IS481 family transposase [Acidobacteriota bacterium]
SNNDSAYMRKLNRRKVKWIVREMDKEELSVYWIAKIQGVTPQWVRRIYKMYHETGQYPYPKKPGRKPKPITIEERGIVLQTRKEHPVVGAVTIEKILDEKGVHMPHNRIHKILKHEGLAIDEPKKQKRRKWIRYERRYSNILWHADWFENKDEQIIIFEDDASRFITGFGVFGNATSKNAVLVFEQAISNYGAPKQLMTDHGIQFTSIPRESCPDPRPNVFQEILSKYFVKHIKARVKHPQSNGKVEKAIHTIQVLRNHFPSWEETIGYYNFKRPHSSLENGCLRTPYQAFIDKKRKNNKKEV